MLSICLVGTSSFAQRKAQDIPNSRATEKWTTAVDQDINSSNAPILQSRLVERLVWSEDFANGIPTSWVNAGTTSGINNDSCKWEYRGSTTVPNNTVGSRGAFRTGTSTIQSASAGNGFVIFDSDYLDNRAITNTAGNPLKVGQALTPHIGTLITDTIDLSGTLPLVILECNYYARRFQGEVFVAVSTDYGATWPDTLQLADPIVNQSTARNSIFRAYLPVGVGGSPSVKLQFIYDGQSRANANGSGYYFAQLDDIKIKEAERNDLALLAFDILSENTINRYGSVPSNQLDPLGYTFDGVFENRGNTNQPNTKLKMEIKDNGGSTVYNNTSAASILSPLDLLVDTVRTPFTPSANYQKYTMKWSVNSDSTDAKPTDNERDNIFFNVTDRVYAMDFNSGSRSNVGTNSFITDGSADFMMVANMYEFLTADTLLGVEVVLSTGTKTGGVLKVYVYDTTTVLNNFGPNTWPEPSPPGLIESLEYTIVGTDIVARKAFIPIPAKIGNFNQDRNLPFGAYYVAVEMSSNGNGNDIIIPSDELVIQDPFSALIMLSGGQDRTVNPRRWYTNGNAFMTRLITRNSSYVGVENVESYNFDVSQNIPNPVLNKSVVNVTLAENAKTITFKLVNTLGQEIAEQTKTNVAEGKYQFEIDANQLSSGIYFYSVSVDGKTISKKLTVQ